MSTIDFSDFDRSIHELFQSLENLKDSPDEASKKIDAFLKKNQEFLAAHKKNPFVEMQLNSLAGRVKEIFPESQKVQGWADFIQTIFKSPVKILEPEEVLAEIEDLKKSISTARGTIMSPGLAARLKAFAENPRIWDFLVAYGKNPTIGRQLLELGILLKKFPEDPEALKLAQTLLELAQGMNLPKEVIPETLKFIPPSSHENLPAEWEHLSLDAKIEWVNLNDGDITALGFTAFDDRLLSFLKEHGRKLRVLRMPSIFDTRGMTTESLNQMLQYCPNLEVMSLHLPPGEFQINELPRNLKVLDLLGGNKGYITQLPPLPKSLISFHLSGSSIEELPTFPPGLKSARLRNLWNIKQLPSFPITVEIIGLENLGLEHLPPFPKSTKFIKLHKVGRHTEIPPLPPGLMGLSLTGFTLKKLPRLEEGLEFLKLSFVNLDEGFNIPTSLKFFNFVEVRAPFRILASHLPKTCHKIDGEEASEHEEKFLESYDFVANL